MEILTRIKPHFLTALYCITLFIIPSSIFAADIAGKVEAIKGTTAAQRAGEQVRQLHEKVYGN